MRRALRVMLVAVVLAGVLLLFVLPGRTFLSQAHSLAATQKQVDELTAENAKLTQEAKRLQTNSVIEQIAREEYGLAVPGQKSYTIIPSAPSTTAPSTKRSTTTTTLPGSGASSVERRSRGR